MYNKPKEPTEKQLNYYARLRKLTPEQLDEAYTQYYLYDHAVPQSRPPIATLAKKYSVSLNAMFRALHNEHLRRNTLL